MRPHSLFLFLIATLCFALAAESTYGQHCAPIYSSYLSETSLKQSKDGKLKIKLKYNKIGGRSHESYQGYLIAFRSSDKSIAFPQNAGELFDPKYAVVVKTDLIKKQPENEDETDDVYLYDAEVDLKKLTLDLVKLRELEVPSSETPLAISFAFVLPFLADEKYSTLEGLPEDRHECNYLDAPALLSTQLPQVCYAYGKQTDSGSKTNPNFFFAFRQTLSR